MAWLGIAHEPCPKCGSTATDEIHKPTLGPDSEREVVLHCFKCRQETSYGKYKLLGKVLVRA